MATIIGDDANAKDTTYDSVHKHCISIRIFFIAQDPTCSLKLLLTEIPFFFTAALIVASVFFELSCSYDELSQVQVQHPARTAYEQGGIPSVWVILF